MGGRGCQNTIFLYGLTYFLCMLFRKFTTDQTALHTVALWTPWVSPHAEYSAPLAKNLKQRQICKEINTHNMKCSLQNQHSTHSNCMMFFGKGNKGWLTSINKTKRTSMSYCIIARFLFFCISDPSLYQSEKFTRHNIILILWFIGGPNTSIVFPIV